MIVMFCMGRSARFDNLDAKKEERANIKRQEQQHHQSCAYVRQQADGREGLR
jgi:hypothetical protein